MGTNFIVQLLNLLVMSSNRRGLRENRVKIQYIEKNSDHEQPVLDITAETLKDSFLLGVIDTKMFSKNLCAWKKFDDEITLRIPLLQMDDIGLAEKYNKNK